MNDILTMSKDELFCRRLSLETDIKTETVFHDLDKAALRMEKKVLKEIKARMKIENLEKEYKEWIPEYIEKRLKELSSERVIKVHYMFAGIGQYDALMTEKEHPSFIGWINRNGSAFCDKPEEATEEEIKLYIQLYADVKNR